MRQVVRKESRWKRDFGYRVRELREGAGLTQMQLAEIAGLHPTYISGIERGQRNVSLVNLHVLALALKTTPAALFD